MRNNKPRDLTNLEMEYEATIYKQSLDENKNEIVYTCELVPSAGTLDELIEKCRKWSITKRTRTTQTTVNNSNTPLVNASSHSA